MNWLVMLQAISDPYCQAVSVAVSACLSAAQLVLYRKRSHYVPQATSPTGLSEFILFNEGLTQFKYYKKIPVARTF